MILVEKKLADSMVHHCHLSDKAQNMQPDEKSSSDGSSSSPPQELMVPFRVYKEKIDASRVPRKFIRFDFLDSDDDDDVAVDDDDDDDEGDMDGLYMYPESDIELLEWSWRPFYCCCVGKFKVPEIYHVEVDGDSCTVEESLKLLKEIGCEKQFIACSVEKERLFFAELNKKEAAKLEGLVGICSVYPRSSLLFDI